MAKLPDVYNTALTLAAAGQQLFALRDDGQVFVLLVRGTLMPDGTVTRFPRWEICPAVPGTLAALEEPPH